MKAESKGAYGGGRSAKVTGTNHSTDNLPAAAATAAVGRQGGCLVKGRRLFLKE
jgi:hypothetical protein